MAPGRSAALDGTSPRLLPLLRMHWRVLARTQSNDHAPEPHAIIRLARARARICSHIPSPRFAPNQFIEKAVRQMNEKRGDHHIDRNAKCAYTSEQPQDQ